MPLQFTTHQELFKIIKEKNKILNKEIEKNILYLEKNLNEDHKKDIIDYKLSLGAAYSRHLIKIFDYPELSESNKKTIRSLIKQYSDDLEKILKETHKRVYSIKISIEMKKLLEEIPTAEHPAIKTQLAKKFKELHIADDIPVDQRIKNSDIFIGFIKEAYNKKY